jgi:hypothetical protein
MRKFIGVFAGALILTSSIFVASAGASGTKNYKYTGQTGGDSSTCGPDWANDSYTRTFKVLRQPAQDGSYRVTELFKGTFLTIAGPSPMSCETGNSNTVAGNVSGKWQGSYSMKVSGGTYTGGTVSCPGQCTTSAFVAAAFGGSATYTLQDWAFEYWTTSGCVKDWVNAITGNGGDIATTCAP